jgi:aquaporin Z
MVDPISSEPSAGSSDASVPEVLVAPAPPSDLRIFGAELVGTAVLMLVGPGSAIIASDVIGVYGVAFAFGLALLAMAYSIGHVSGCHINPAVTLAFLVTRRLSVRLAAFYWVAQAIGAVVGGFLLWIVTETGDLDTTGVFAANGWGSDIGSPYGLGAVVVVEIVFTALLVFVVLSTTTAGFVPGFGALSVGLTLTMIHLATIPVDNTSVNPARSLGAALFSGSDAIVQLWAFIVFPLLGAVVGVLVWLLVHENELEETMLGTERMMSARARVRARTRNREDRLD